MSSEMGIEEHHEDVLRICSYHRSEFALAVVRTRPHTMQAIEGLLQTHFTTPSLVKLGILDRLTPELIINILLQLDIISYLEFRRVNRHARVIATRLHEYRLVSTHGLEGLTAVLRTGLRQYFTIKDLYDPLVTYSCKVCGGFGCFLYLPDCTRCCFACLREAPELRVTNVTSRVKGLCQSQRRKLRPTLRRVRGQYCLSNLQRVFTGRELMATRQAVAILHSLGVPETSIDMAVCRQADWESNRFASATMYPWYNAQRGEADRGVNCKAIRLHLEKSMAPVRGRSKDVEDHLDRVFSRPGFLKHFKTCSLAQDLWARSVDGAIMEESRFVNN